MQRHTKIALLGGTYVAALAVALLAKYFIKGEQVIQPNSSERMMSTIRSIPAPLFYGGLAVMLVVMLAGMILIRVSDPMMRKNAVERAKLISQSQWYVKEVFIIDREEERFLRHGGWHVQSKSTPPYECGGILTMATVGSRRIRLQLHFRTGHPDFALLRQLRLLQKIGFELVTEAMSQQLDSESAAYLRIKS